MPRFQKGQSGNPNGRPKKDRALTAILETAGGKTIEKDDGTKTTRRRLMADLLWKAVTEGSVVLPNGKAIDMAAQDWFDTVQFLYKHIDGPPKQNIELNGSLEMTWKDFVDAGNSDPRPDSE